MSTKNNLKLAKREETYLECAPIGKFSRLVHQFMIKKKLPVAFSAWGICSIPVAGGLIASYAQPILLAANETHLDLMAAGLALPLLLPLFVLLRKPTHIRITSEGISYTWHYTIRINSKLLPWEDVETISLIQPKNTSRAQSRTLSFKGAGQSVDLKVDEVTDPLKLPSLYQAIITHAPQVPRDAEIQSILGADKSSASYTELWLKALTAPPERSRLEPLSTGTSLQDGKYIVLDKIGSGGQGVAYTATTGNGSEKNTVVLKEYVLPLGVSHANKAESLEKFQMEAQILGELDHPQIVRLLDFFFEDHRGYMVLEYVQGRNLQSLCHSEGALSENKVIELAKQMSNILDYLHSRAPAIIHRDFTPDNLILTADGTLKLIDFNVAQQQKLSATATVVGKHSYIAPDQFRGQATPQSDIYSMGASIAYLLTATEPKPISSSHPREKNRQVSTEMDAIVAKCTAVDPSRRFTSAKEFRQAIELLSGSVTENVSALEP